ncbi:MAG TPA: FecR domain-containing protein [Bradyrhizobium sp.]|uniref:FecR family protein n=1 Tax=Bradyrhizobium sp. TaxID=376 RepID=UPI002D7F3622|nr:FecR domain-containing protein [Bradyrhizobium sp.]HET7889671.1 FecR domain-containing protein [Bradyrhizobium sp.]
MYLSSTGSRHGGQNATRRWSSSKALALVAGLMFASSALAQTPQPAPAQPATAAAQPAADEPIGNVATLTGSASVVRNQNTLPLKLKDDIYLNDVVTTFADSALGITFNDETTFNLNAKASITIDDFIYEDGGKQNSALFDVTKGTVAFVASAVAKTGNMKITTPTATLGIRGTTGLVEVNGAGSGAHNIKLYPDPDGHVGTIDVADRNGTRLGTLNRGASGFTVRAGAGGRFTAAPLQISQQQAARDQGFVRQVHAAQVVGRQVVTEQRALRRANPNLNRNNQRGTPGQPGQRQPGQPQPGQRQPGQQQPGQRQNNLQQRGDERQNRQQGQPGAPNRAGQPGQPGQPATPNRAGENRQGGQPGAPNRNGPQGQPSPNRATEQGQPPGAQRPGTQQGAQPQREPALRQSGPPNRGAAPPRRAPPPKKPPREKRR